MILRAVAIFAAISMMVGIGASPARADDGSTVVAEVDGRPLTRADLEKREKTDLFQAKYKYYLAEHQAVEKLVKDQLLENAAAKEHISVDELLKRHAEAPVKDPTEDQLEIFYEGMQTEKPYKEVRGEIVDHIRGIRRQKTANAYMESLRKQADVKIVLTSPSATVASNGAPTLGPADASVKVVEFADYQCPYCKQMHPLMKKLREEFPKTALVYEDFPLPMHPNAEKAAEAAHCAGDQGKYWEYHDAIYDHNGSLDVASLKDISKSLKLDQASFDKCLDSGKQAPVVAKGLEEGKKLGLTGTPTFFVNGHVISGAPKYDVLKELVEQQSTSAAAGAQARAN